MFKFSAMIANITKSGLNTVFYTGPQLDSVSPSCCCGASFGIPGLKVRDVQNYPKEGYVSSVTAGVRVYPFVVPDNVVEEFETHTKITMGGDQWSLLTVDNYVKTADYKLKKTPVTWPTQAITGEVFFPFWESLRPILTYTEGCLRDCGYTAGEAERISRIYQTRHHEVAQQHRQGKHLMFILGDTQVPEFEAAMADLGLTRKVKAHPNKVANLNYSDMYNPRLNLFFLEGMTNV